MVLVQFIPHLLGLFLMTQCDQPPQSHFPFRRWSERAPICISWIFPVIVLGPFYRGDIFFIYFFFFLYLSHFQLLLPCLTTLEWMEYIYIYSVSGWVMCDPFDRGCQPLIRNSFWIILNCLDWHIASSVPTGFMCNI